jgi:AraC-like DNA-binding protein
MTRQITFASARSAGEALAPGRFAGPRYDYRDTAERLLRGAQRRGFDIAALLAQAGLAQGVSTASAGSISRITLIRLISSVKKSMDDEFFGLTEHRCRPGSFAFTAEMGLHCTTLGAVIEQSTRLYRLLTDDITLRFQADSERASLQIVVARPDLDPGGFLIDYHLLQWHRMLSWMVGFMIPVKQLDLTSQDEPGPERLAYFIRGDWLAGAKVNAMHLSPRYLTLPVSRTRAELDAYFTKGAEGGFVWPDGESSWTAGVKAKFSQALASGKGFELDRVAASLQVTGNTLRRHLREEGSGYQKLLDEFRRDIAIEKLHVQRSTVAQVAELLGFSESRSFTRAFKQWTGVPPSAYLVNDTC